LKVYENDDYEEVERNQEPEFFKKLHHKNICRFIAWKFGGTFHHHTDGSTRKVNYIVLEFCENGDLTNVIAKGGLSERIAVKWAKQIIDALMHIHSCGIAHRDIKLQNILLDANN